MFILTFLFQKKITQDCLQRRLQIISQNNLKKLEMDIKVKLAKNSGIVRD